MSTDGKRKHPAALGLHNGAISIRNQRHDTTTVSCNTTNKFP
jgi:hypothetical protein